MMASMCQPGTKGVDGSTTAHACRTNSRRLREAISASISSRREGLVSNGAKLFEFFIGQLGEVRLGRDLDRAARQAGVFGVHDVFVTQQILGEENSRSDVAGVRQFEQAPANRHPALCLAPGP